ncbi:MAG TPA: translocation/assembly module TamB domain-containing protein [Bacteroidota bacterium]|nr:translocation/assembly module TamB domain-containing protein [Bacteroidota bacterium]
MYYLVPSASFCHAITFECPVPGLWKNTYFRRTVKTAAWVVGIVIVLIVALAIALQLPQVQNYIAQRVIAPISAKTQTRIELGSITISLPNSIVLKKIFIEDRTRDTLLAVGEVHVSVNLFGLVSRSVHISSIRVDSLTANVTRSMPDSVFNFDFLLDALSSDSTASKPPPDTTGGGWTIGVYGLTLNGINVSYDDAVTGMTARIRLGAFDLSMDMFDLHARKFRIASVSLSNTSAVVVQTKESPPDTTVSKPTDIDLGKASLSGVHVLYENTATDMRIAADIGSSSLDADRIDLPSKRIALNKFSIANTDIHVRVPRTVRDTTTAADTAAFQWIVSLGKLSIGMNTLQYDVSGTATKRGLDPNHLSFSPLSLEAENLYLSSARADLYLKHASLAERSGFVLRNFTFTAVYDSLHAQLSDFALETPSTTIRQDMLLTYPSFSVLQKHPGDAKVRLSVDETHIGIADLLLFNPTLPVKHSDRSIGIEAALSGYVKDLRIDQFTAKAGDSTIVDVTGTVRGLPDAKHAMYDIAIQRIATGRNDVRLFAVDTLVPKSVSIPASVAMTGSFKGTMNDFSATAQVWSTVGTIAAQAALSGGAASRTSRWNAQVEINELDLGALTNDSSGLGPLTMKAGVNGAGMTKEDIAAQVDVNVDKAVLLGYPYRRLTAHGNAGADFFDGTIELADSNIAFQYQGKVNISKEHPAYQFTFDLKGADLHRLRLSKDDLRVQASLVSDLTGAGVNDINGHADLRNVVILKNGKRFAIDSLMYASVNKSRNTHVSVESPVFGATFDGTIALGNLPDALRTHFHRYFTVHDTTTKPEAAVADSQAFSFKIELRDPETITDVFMPSLRRIDAGVIEGNYNSLKNDLNVNVGLNSIKYNDITVDTMQLTVTSDARQLRAGLHVSSIADSQFNITNFDVKGIVEHDSIDVAMESTDNDGGGTKMLLAGIINSIKNGYQFRFRPDGVVFQNRKWTVAPDNYVRTGPGSLIVHHVTLSDSGQSISAQSTNEGDAHSPLKIEFQKFDLATLSQIAERDTGFARGRINGTVELRNLDKAMTFVSDLTIDGFSFVGKPVGTVALRANNQTANVYDIALDLTGNGNQLGVRGQYKTVDTVNIFDLGIQFSPMNLASIEPFTFGSLTRLSGSMTGNLRLTGTASKPAVSGTLAFSDAAFDAAALGSYLRLNGGEMGFDQRGIELRSLSLADSLGNTASIKGMLGTTDYKNFNFDLSLQSKNFLLMNKPPDPKAIYYGTVFLNSDMRIQGTQTRPVIDVQASVAKGSAVTFILPEASTDVQNEEGVVTFVDLKNPGNPIMTRKTAGTSGDSLSTRFAGIDLTSNIEVTKDSKLRIFVDPTSGDSLVVQGDATFSIGMDPSGALSLTGRYEIAQGSYQVSFNQLITREFAIEKGSSLTWFGTPFDADVDLTAVYTVKTSPLDLVQDQIAGMSQEERTKYKQELPIEVHLEMKGRLMKPEISFHIDMPEDQRGALGGAVYSKINLVNEQESEVNKQAFALLVLGRFVSSDPLASADEGSGLSGLARSSVSRLLTSQLNQLSRKYVKGVDLNVGLESGQDYSTGTAENRTQLQVALSKSMFNERVTVQVGGNVDLEGPRTEQNSLNNFAGDVKVGYKLTEDGRWQMQVFRQRAYEGVIEGDLTETGVGLVFTIDYDKLVGFTLKPVNETNDTEATK